MPQISKSSASMLEDAWYCAAWSHELRYPRILGRKILNRRIALFRDNEGRVNSIDAVCPHRGADLSLGRLVESHVQCPLHGWQFDGAGKCVSVPSQPAGVKIPPRAIVPSYLVVERQGVIWIWLGAVRESMPDPPHYDVWEETPERHRHFSRPELWRCSFVNAVENAIDVTHVPFVHIRSLGSNQQRLHPTQQLVIDRDLRGFFGKNCPESPWGTFETRKIFDDLIGRIVTALLGMTTIRREYYRFDLGGSLFFYIEWETGTWDVLVAHSTPSDSFHTWFFGASIRTRATHWVGNICQKWFMKALVQEDKSEVERMLSNEPDSFPSPVSVVGDEAMLTFRRIHNHHVNLQERQSTGTTGTTI